MPKIVINSSAGGFGLSHHGLMLYAKLKNLNMKVYCKSVNGYEIYKKKIGEEIKEYLLFHCVLPEGDIFPELVNESFINAHTFEVRDYSFLIQPDGRKLLEDFRSDPCLVKVVESIGDLAFAEFADLKVVDVPDDVIWQIWTFDSGSEIVKEVSREWR